MRVLIVVMALLCLTGCIDMKQDLTVAGDGQATFAIELSMDAAILAMQAKAEAASSFCQPPSESAEGLTIEFVRTTEKGDVVCTITARGSIDRLAEVTSKNNLLPRADSGPAASAPTMLIVKDGDNYRFDVAMTFSKPEPPKEGGPDMSKMMIAMTAGRSLSWSVTAPSILQTSGKLSEDGRTASYSVPLATLVSGETPEAKFSTTFSTGSGNGLLDWIGGLFD